MLLITLLQIGKEAGSGWRAGQGEAEHCVPATIAKGDNGPHFRRPGQVGGTAGDA